MTTYTEQLRQLTQFKALTLFERDVAEAIAPFQAQLKTLERERGDYQPRAYSERERSIKERIDNAVDETLAAWETKAAAFTKVAGRDTPPQYPVKDTNRALVLLTQLGVMSAAGGAEQLKSLVERAETTPDDQDVRSLIQAALPVLKDKVATAGPISGG